MIAGLPQPRFLWLLTIPLFGNILGALFFALGFIFDLQFLTPVSAVVSILPTMFVIVLIVRRLLRRRWIEAALLGGTVWLSIYGPSIDFRPDYWTFQMKKETYVAAVRADPSPSPKFISFLVREYPALGGGGTWYHVVYDESGEIGLPPESRSKEWNDRHAGWIGGGSPFEHIDVAPLGDNFFSCVVTS